MEEKGLNYSMVQRSIVELMEHDILSIDVTPQGQPNRYQLLDVYIPDRILTGLTTPGELKKSFAQKAQVQQVQSSSSEVQSERLI